MKPPWARGYRDIDPGDPPETSMPERDECPECECDPCRCPLCPGCGEHVEQSACDGCDICAKCAPDLGQHFHGCSELHRPLLHSDDVDAILTALQLSIAHETFKHIKLGADLSDAQRYSRALRRLIDSFYGYDWSRQAARKLCARNTRATLRRMMGGWHP